MEDLSKFAAKAQTQYQIRPPFKAKFRPAEAREAIEKLIPDMVRQYQQRNIRGQAAAAEDNDSDEDEDDENGEERQQRAAEKMNWKDTLAQ